MLKNLFPPRNVSDVVCRVSDVKGTPQIDPTVCMDLRYQIKRSAFGLGELHATHDTRHPVLRLQAQNAPLEPDLDLRHGLVQTTLIVL